MKLAHSPYFRRRNSINETTIDRIHFDSAIHRHIAVQIYLYTEFHFEMIDWIEFEVDQLMRKRIAALFSYFSHVLPPNDFSAVLIL